MTATSTPTTAPGSAAGPTPADASPPPRPLEGKVAVVTGASRGIGASVAARLSAAGASVMLTARTAEDLETAAARIAGPTAVFAANAGDPEAARACVAATVATFGRLDVVVNNAGTNPHAGPLVGLDVPRATKTLQVNLLAPLAWTVAAWEAGMGDRGGAVVNVASINGLRNAPGLAWYATTKAALMHLTRELAAELAPGVRVNAVAPGLVKTDMARDLWEAEEAAAAAGIPLRRLGEPADVAEAVLFLASPAASWITGHTVVVDGGTLLGRPGRR